jgi:membrane associated rhomboid family serine protease
MHNPTFTRLASSKAPPNNSNNHQTTTKKKGKSPQPEERQAEAARKASQLLKQLSKTGKKTPAAAPRKPDKIIPASPLSKEEEGGPTDDEGGTMEMSEEEVAAQHRILKQRRKIFWPGIWTIFAVTGTYSAFAYLDTKYGSDDMTDVLEEPDSARLPQTWFLTPTVVKEGFKAGWHDLNKLTIGIVTAFVLINFTRRSPIQFWERLIHITGEKRYTAFTYPFVHSSWGHLAQNAFGLCWFVPGVVRYFDGDLFHTAAFFVSVPLITSYLQHFAFRISPPNGIPLNMGASGAVAAIFGAFCMIYPHEKVWWPSGVVLRLDSQYWAGLFALWQVVLMSTAAVTAPGNLTAAMVSYFVF